MRATIWGNGWQRPILTTSIGLPAIPRIGERIDIDGNLYEVTQIIWNYDREIVGVYVEENNA
jgi:hypothetical protein